MRIVFGILALVAGFVLFFIGFDHPTPWVARVLMIVGVVVGLGLSTILVMQ